MTAFLNMSRRFTILLSVLAVLPILSPSLATAALYRTSLAEQRDNVVANRDVALSRGLQLIAYEGGQHLAAPSGADAGTLPTPQNPRNR